MGGIVISMIVVSIFFTIISRFTLERHRQDSLESFNSIITDINIFCEFGENNSISKRITLSDLVENIYASRDFEMRIENQRSSDQNLCMDFNEEIICTSLNCEISMNEFSAKMPLMGLVNRILGRIGYSTYQVNIFREDDGVHLTIDL